MLRRRSIRLPAYDYTSAGAYFVTICVWGRECALGDVVDGEMGLSDLGHIVAESWAWLADHHPYVTLDAWAIMPNHMHGIIIIHDDVCRGGSRTAPTTGIGAASSADKRKPLGRLIGAFKTTSTKRINEVRGLPGTPFWQRNYYERVVRNEGELRAIREYIADNPLHWQLDRENPANERTPER